MKTKLVASAAVLILGALAAYALPESPDSLIGSEVMNNSGDTLGTLKEFVSDPNSDERQFAVVESGGVLGVGGKSYLVPWEAFQVEQDAEGESTRVILDATADKLQGATEYDPNKPIPANDVYTYWGIDPEGSGAGKSGEESVDPEMELDD